MIYKINFSKQVFEYQVKHYERLTMQDQFEDIKF